jgi:hypothetical protein
VIHIEDADGAVDSVDCGDGTDTVYVNATETDDVVNANCENVVVASHEHCDGSHDGGGDDSDSDDRHHRDS